jgi:RND family efflux transporter MFP subunit
LNAVALFAGALALSACGGGDDAAAPAPQPPAVEIVSVAAADGAQAIRASGEIAYKRETALAFNVPGVIGAISVDVGDTVRAGQRLANLRLTAVQAGANEAQAALETAERNLARTQTLFDRGLVAQARLDDAELAVERARAGLDQAGFNRDTAVLNAPAAGVILRRLAEPAQVANAGTPVLLLGETASGLIVRASVSAAEAARVSVGDPAQVALSGGAGAARAGRVERIAPKSDAATGAFELEVRIADVTGLRSGMIAEVRVEPDEATPAEAPPMAIPVLSLLDARADQGVVYVVGDDDVARRRAIRTGGVVGEQVMVVSGLEPGERVVARGAAFVRDGEPVRAAADAP